MRNLTFKPEMDIDTNISKIQRSLYDFIREAIGDNKPKKITTNQQIATALTDLSDFNIVPNTAPESPIEKYEIGYLDFNGSTVTVVVDPLMRWLDTKIIGEDFVITVDTDDLPIY